MMDLRDGPVFALSADLDWASDHCVDDYCGFLEQRGLRSTLFVTHASPAIDRACRSGRLERGIHPNFSPGSSHGADIETVLDTVTAYAPEAVGSRSHRMINGTDIQNGLRRRGFLYDSSPACWLQAGLMPLREVVGLIMLPIFWEDDAHNFAGAGDWRFEAFRDRFFTPGLKILAIHPFFFTLNLATREQYQRCRHAIPTLTAGEAAAMRIPGPGARTFVEAAVTAIQEAGHPLLTLREVFEHHGRPLLGGSNPQP